MTTDKRERTTAPNKKIKTFQKPIDKSLEVWYNISTEKGENKKSKIPNRKELTTMKKQDMINYILSTGMMVDGNGTPLTNLDYMKKYSKADVARLYEKAVAYSNR